MFASGVIPEGGWHAMPAPLLDAIALISKEREAIRKGAVSDGG